MKNISLVLAALTLSFNAVANTKSANKPKKPAAASAVKAVVDPAASSITWTGKKVTGSHTGKVSVKEGSFDYNKDGMITKGQIVADMTSIANEDVKDAEYNKKLVGHLKSEDFFNTEKYPTATFAISSFNEIHNFAPGSPNLEMKGTLTIHGVSKPFTAAVIQTANDTGFDLKGKVLVDRTQYGLKYNSKKFFDVKNLGDKMIDDTFEVDVMIVAKKK